MMSPDEYLEQARRAMTGMDPAVQEDILREIRSHLAEGASGNAGNASVAISDLGSPVELGRRYRELYGYGRRFKFLFTMIAFLLAVPSVPVLGITEQGFFPYTFSLIVLAGVIAWLLWVSVVAGSRVGLVAGIAALVARLVAIGAVALTQAGATPVDSGFGLFVAVSVMLPVLGWLPGTAKRVWSKPRAEL